MALNTSVVSTKQLSGIKSLSSSEKQNSIRMSANNILTSDLKPTLSPRNPSIYNGTSLPEIPKDVETLTVLVNDLMRRLQNANHTVSSQKEIVRKAVEESEKLKLELRKVSSQLRLEVAKNNTLNRKYQVLLESKLSEERRQSIETMKHELRLMTVDQQMTKSKLKLESIQKTKDKINRLIDLEDSQNKRIGKYHEEDELVKRLCGHCLNGDVHGCRDIVQQGVSVNEVDNSGFLPIHFACRNGSEEVIQFLLDNGSDTTTYMTGKNPIEVAAKHGHTSIIQMLHDNNGDIHEAGTGGFAPIVSATMHGQINCLGLLLSLGADCNAVDSLGNTCLHIAVNAASPCDPQPMIPLLLKYGADTTKKNSEGYSPLDLAMMKGNMRVIEVIKLASSDR